MAKVLTCLINVFNYILNYSVDTIRKLLTDLQATVSSLADTLVSRGHPARAGTSSDLTRMLTACHQNLPRYDLAGEMEQPFLCSVLQNFGGYYANQSRVDRR